ncbi:nitrate reductase molybdenum cofactor assembly chaperone [candidate division KSB1 bacterium]|nr:nitrate reductase molybdenum cofactor assembly chaperone [candidate division KSB1 bacterium]
MNSHKTKEKLNTISKEKHLYEHLSALLEYPQDDIFENISGCLNSLQSLYPEAKSQLESFSKSARSTNLFSLQALYNFSFDINPVCTLDIGYHVFGESYKRGSFLVGMKKMLKEQGIETKDELPDYLPNILRLLAGISKNDDSVSLATLIVAPALARMKKSFKENNNCYGAVVRAVDCVIRKDYDITEIEIKETSPQDNDFLNCHSKGCGPLGSISQSPEKRKSKLNNRG